MILYVGVRHEAYCFIRILDRPVDWNKDVLGWVDAPVLKPHDYRGEHIEGFEWGYTGKGPHITAYNLLRDALLRKGYEGRFASTAARGLMNPFVYDVVQYWPNNHTEPIGSARAKETQWALPLSMLVAYCVANWGAALDEMRRVYQVQIIPAAPVLEGVDNP